MLGVPLFAAKRRMPCEYPRVARLLRGLVPTAVVVSDGVDAGVGDGAEIGARVAIAEPRGITFFDVGTTAVSE